MRFVTFTSPDGPRAAVVDRDVLRALPPGATLATIIKSGGDLLQLGAAALRASDLVVPLGDAILGAPLNDPTTIRDFMTFERHVQGVVRLADPGATIPDRWYAAPAFYFSNPASVHGPFDDVAVPPGSELFDLELEVAAILNRGGRDLTPDDAEDCIAGYLLMNDWSARDLQFAEMTVRLGPTKGKDSAISLGPYLVTPEELEPFRLDGRFNLPVTAAINGEVIGTDSLAAMSFSFGQMISYASRGTVVRPGDIFGSGTVGGGCLAELWGRCGRDFHAPLRPGDVVTLDAGILGQQRSRVVEGPAGVDSALFRSRSRST